jgi:hypothetical protein
VPDTGAGDVGELEADAAHGDVLLCLHHILVQVVGVADALACNQGDKVIPGLTAPRPSH